MIVDGILEPMELGHLPYKKATFEDYVGMRGLDRVGRKKWRKHVTDVVARLVAAMQADEVVLGGGNVKKLKELPPLCREGDNDNAFVGGFRLWEQGPPDGTSAHAAAPTAGPGWGTRTRAAPMPILDSPLATRHWPLFFEERSCKSTFFPMRRRLLGAEPT